MTDHAFLWHVLFHRPPKRRWYAREFSHVSIAFRQNETWVHLDLHASGFRPGVYFTFDEVQDFLAHACATTTIVRLQHVPIRSHFLRPMSCVSFVKHVMGLRSRALLPDTLFRDLVENHGGEVINGR